MRIYLIEDDEMIRRALLRTLRPLGAEVRGFEEPLEALNAARTEVVDLVISDYSLPGLDGIHALSELRRLHPGVATLLLSGNTPDDAISDALKAGVVDRYLAKPWRHNELQAALGELIRSAA